MPKIIMNKGFVNGINRESFQEQIELEYGSISEMVEELKGTEFEEDFTNLFNLELSVGFFEALMEGVIKFENSEKGRAKLELLSERLFDLWVHQLFDRFCLIFPTNGNQEYAHCNMCLKLDLIGNLKKQSNDTYRHKACVAEYARLRRQEEKLN